MKSTVRAVCGVGWCGRIVLTTAENVPISVNAPLPSTGVYVIGFSYPVVPKGKARIRVQISAAHTDEDIDHCVDAFVQTGRKHGVVSWTRQAQESGRFSLQCELLNSTEPLALADHAARYSKPMRDVDGNMSYICRSTGVNVICEFALLNKALLLRCGGVCILRKRAVKSFFMREKMFLWSPRVSCQ